MGQGQVAAPLTVVPYDVDAEPVAWRETSPLPGHQPRPSAAFLHGLGGSRIAWDPQLTALGARRRCGAWDMPGYGASAPLPTMTFPDLAATAAGWVSSMGESPAHVVGLSMGGMIALHLALSHGGAVRSLVLIDTSPAFGFDGGTTAEAWVEARLSRLCAGGTPADAARESVTAIVAPHAAAGAIQLAVDAMSRIAPGPFEQAVRCLPTHDVRDELSAIDVPTLVIVGELDAETPLPFSQHLAATMPRARLEVVPGAGHLSSIERPDLVNPLIADFLEEHD